MNAVPLHRMAVIVGWTLAVVIAVWWLGSTRLVVEQGRDAAGTAADTLRVLFLVRAMALAASNTRVAALRGWRQGVAVGLGLIAPAWPLVLAAWSASAIPLTAVLLGEALLVAGSLALPLIGQGFHRWLHQPEYAVMTGTAVGLALAAAVWLAPPLLDLTPP